jgi:hypothetical protein
VKCDESDFKAQNSQQQRATPIGAEGRSAFALALWGGWLFIDVFERNGAAVLRLDVTVQVYLTRVDRPRLSPYCVLT